MAPDTPATPIPLTYEAGLARERLPDGTLRMTIVTERAGAAAILSGAGVIAMFFVAFLCLGWYRYLPERLLIMVFVGAPVGIGAMLITLTLPRRQTHVVEVSPAGLRLETSIGGDPVRRFHPRDEILAVRGTSALEIHTKRDAYSCMSARADVVKIVVATIHEELYRVVDDDDGETEGDAKGTSL
jgi:hypothetical protein